MRSDKYTLSVRNISKSFPGGVRALSNVSLDLKPGEILALLGENGSGKSTLVKILYGVYVPDEGEVFLDGRRISILSPKDAINMGIVMIPQTPHLIDKLSVAENILIGMSKLNMLVTVNKIVKTFRALGSDLGIKIDPNAMAWTLTYTQKQLVEIARAILFNARILLLDEAFTYLPLEERWKFYKYLIDFKIRGNSILLVTHKITEALEVADRIAVLRRGALVTTLSKEEATVEKLKYAMFGENGASISYGRLQSSNNIRGNPLLNVRDLTIIGDYGEEAVKGVSLTVRAGEVVGIAGITGNGQRELVEAIMGLRKVHKGSIVIDGIDVTNKGVNKVRDLGVGYIPDSPLKFGVAPDMDIFSNIAILFSRNGFIIQHKEMLKLTREIIDAYHISTSDERTAVKYLSGGNLMKVIIGRELAYAKRVLIACNPTRNLDELTGSRVRLAIKQKAANWGLAVLLVSEDIDEVYQVSDVLYVMISGKLFGPFDPDVVQKGELEKFMVT